MNELISDNQLKLGAVSPCLRSRSNQLPGSPEISCVSGTDLGDDLGTADDTGLNPDVDAGTVVFQVIIE